MLDTNSETYYRQLCEHLGVAVIATDLDLNIRTWNAAAARTFGAAADRMIGTPLVQVIPQERRRIAERMLRRAIRTGETIQLEFEHRDARGRRRELAGTISAVVCGTGACIGASICIRDITRRIELQGEVHESRKMVALGEMAGAIAHHFNNILGGVIMSIDYAATSDDPLVRSRVFEQVGESLQRATSLVGGLLAFAQGDHRQTGLAGSVGRSNQQAGSASETGDLSEVLAEVADGIRRDIVDQQAPARRGRAIDFEFIAGELPAVPVASGPLLTILQNISRNAIEAMPDGGKLRMEVSLGTDSVMIVISDTGCGLDDMAKSRMFEPFWTTKGEPAGQQALARRGRKADSAAGGSAGEAMGLGLAIAHGLTRMIGGSISVQSKKGEGASFRITLPIGDGA
ncbi:MAG: PAS domain S-box protein [Planctomycetes bacterium]|nr:PAS domain S-box protein [Planctomycetota bacterium]